MQKNDKKTVLITGGTNGIGKSIAKNFYNNGFIVFVTGTNTKIIDKINNEENPRYRAIKSDFNQESFHLDLKNHLKEVEKIDILINNAGINKIDNFTQTKTEDFNKLINVNLKASYEISKIVVEKMINNNFGRIINISSIFGKLSKPKRSLYSMTKFGIHGLTVSLAAELSSKNILTNTVSPGFINTDLTRKILSEKEIKSLSKQVPIGRFGNPDEVAELVFFLSSEKNTYISGQNIFIDGGFSIV